MDFVVLGIILLAVWGIMWYSLRLQRKAIKTQDSAVKTVDESIRLQKEALEIGRESNQLLTEILKTLKDRT